MRERYHVHAGRILVLAAVLATSTLVRAGSPDPQADELWLHVETPEADAVIRSSVELVALRGRAGVGPPFDHDVCLALDLSASTLAASGSDLDGDGVTGRTRGGPRGSQARARRIAPVPEDAESVGSSNTDPGDSVLEAEIEAALRLSQRLPARSVRLGLVTFSAGAVARASVGPPEKAARALLELGPVDTHSGTDMGAALDACLALFEKSGKGELRGRFRSIVLLSDGQPDTGRQLGTGMRQGMREALAGASRASEAGVRIFAFGIGEEALRKPMAFEIMASRSGGRFMPVPEPADVVLDLPRLGFTGIDDVEIRNLETEQLARAMRRFPDGSFDGLVPLVPGANTIEVVAREPGGNELRRRLRVHYEKPASPTPEARASAVALLDTLRERTRETQLLQRVRIRRDLRRDLKIRTED